MCPTCNCNSSSIPGPGEVASALLGVAADSAASKVSRKVLFWAVAVPLFPFAVVGVFGWWTIALVALLAALSAAGLAIGRVMHRFVVQTRPEPTHEMRDMLTARGLRTIPAPVQLARPALPRNLAITRRRQALPAAAKALPAPEVTGRVVPAPAAVPVRK